MVAIGKDSDDLRERIVVRIDYDEVLAWTHRYLMRILDKACDEGKGGSEIAERLGLDAEEFAVFLEALKRGRHFLAETEVGMKVYERLMAGE